MRHALQLRVAMSRCNSMPALGPERPETRLCPCRDCGSPERVLSRRTLSGCLGRLVPFYLNLFFLPLSPIGEFCAVKPPPAHSKDRVESFSVICRPLHKSQGFRSHERPKFAPKSILKFEYTVLNLSIYQPNRGGW